MIANKLEEEKQNFDLYKIDKDEEIENEWDKLNQKEDELDKEEEKLRKKAEEINELEAKKEEVETLLRSQNIIEKNIEEEKRRINEERSKVDKESKKVDEEKREVYRLRIEIAEERTKMIDDRNEALRLKERAKEFNLESFGRIHREREEAFQKGHAAAMKNYKKAFNEEYIKSMSDAQRSLNFQNINPQVAEVTLEKAYKMGFNEAENELRSKDQEISDLKKQLEKAKIELNNINKRNLLLEHEYKKRNQNNTSPDGKEQSQGLLEALQPSIP